MSGSTIDPNASPNGAMPNWFDNAFSSPTFGALAGAAAAAGQMAMPTRMPTPMGAVIGSLAGGAYSGASQAQKYQAQDQANQQGALSLEQAKALQPLILQQNQQMMSGGAGGGQSGDPNQPLIAPAFAAMMARRLSMDPKNARAAAPWLDYLDKLNPTGGGRYLNTAGQSVPVPGADAAAGSRASTVADATAPTAVATANAIGQNQAVTDIKKAYGLLGPDLQKSLNDAGVHLDTLWKTPQSYAPGTTVASPSQMQNPTPTPVPPDPFPEIAARTVKVESGGDPNATNSNSTAAGGGQFISGTWPQVIRSTRPDIAAGKTDAQLLPLRSDPKLATSATEQYARQNGAALAQAGLPVTPGNVYLAHQFGPGTAATMLKMTPDTSSAWLGSGVLNANPNLKGKTVGQIIGSANSAMSGVGTPTQPQAQPPQGAAPPPGFPLPGAPTPGSPQNPAASGPAVVPASPQITESQEEGKRLAGLPTEVTAQAKESQNALNRIGLAKSAIASATAGGLPPGFYSPEMAEAAAAAKSLGINIKALGVDPSAVPNQQVAHENLVQVSGEIMKRLFPQRTTNMDLKLYGEALPSYGMDPAALGTLLDRAQDAAQYDVSKANSLHQYKAKNGTLNGWESNFYNQNGYGPQFFDALSQGKSGASSQASSAPSPLRSAPTAAVSYLKSNPGMAAQFDAKYGPGAASQVLGSK